jgi:hypothetical protein
MASIGPVQLEIFKGAQSPDGALVRVSYVVSATLDDTTSGRNYRELVQLVRVGLQIGQPGLEHVLAGGTMADGVVGFTSNSSFQRIWELDIPMSVLEQGILSPFQADPIRARVTLTPLPMEAPTRESNIVNINQPAVVVEA